MCVCVCLYVTDDFSKTFEVNLLVFAIMLGGDLAEDALHFEILKFKFYPRRGKFVVAVLSLWSPHSPRNFTFCSVQSYAAGHFFLFRVCGFIHLQKLTFYLA